MSTAMIEQQAGYKPPLISLEDETQHKSFEQVCREAAGPVAAIVDHPQCPKQLAEMLVGAAMEIDNSSQEGEFEQGQSWGQYVSSVLSRINQ